MYAYLVASGWNIARLGLKTNSNITYLENILKLFPTAGIHHTMKKILILVQYHTETQVQ
jgi:hypothetical protein